MFGLLHVSLYCQAIEEHLQRHANCCCCWLIPQQEINETKRANKHTLLSLHTITPNDYSKNKHFFSIKGMKNAPSFIVNDLPYSRVCTAEVTIDGFMYNNSFLLLLYSPRCQVSKEDETKVRTYISIDFIS